MNFECHLVIRIEKRDMTETLKPNAMRVSRRKECSSLSHASDKSNLKKQNLLFSELNVTLAHPEGKNVILKYCRLTKPVFCGSTSGGHDFV